MEAIPLIEKFRSEWDAVVHQSDEAWVYHEYAWCMEVSVGVWGYESLCFLITDHDRIVGICPLFLRERRAAPGLRWRFLSTNGFGVAGPAFVPALSVAQRRECIAATFTEIDRLAQALGIDRLDIRIPPLAPASLTVQPALSRSFSVSGFRDRSTYTYLVALGERSVEELWLRLEKRCRGSIRKAQRNGVTVREVDAGASVELYYELHRTTYRRTRVRPHPRSYFETIYRNGWATCFVAEHDGQTIAALNVLAFKRGALYWTSASVAEALSLGANNLLQWYAIQWGLAQGYDWYEVGEAFRNPADTKQAGLTMFKASFGGELHPFYRYVKVYRPLHHSSYAFLQHVGRTMRRMAA